MADERVQRRLAAILATDVVGYSRLMERDEVGTLASLKARRKAVLEPLVARHKGRIFKLTGDGALVEFASAVNAVQCANDLQTAMADANSGVQVDSRIVLRIGVNLGDVMVEGNDLYGDGVNIAARLEGLAEAGGVLVSGTAYDYVKNKVSAGFEDLGIQGLKNIAEPVRLFRVKGTPAVLIAAPPIMAGKPSIAVLPFTNMSGDAEQEYFSDGITEDIITELSRFRNLLVIARNSSFVYKGMSINVGRVAHELGVDYVLEGSVRRAGSRVRITAQLVDASSGKHIWAERYDRELADVFAVQDDVTINIVGALTVELEDEVLGRAKRKRPENLQAYEHWLRGKRFIWTTGQRNLEARHHFERAITMDPDFSRAHSGMAITFQMEALEFPLPADFHLAYDKAFSFAERALRLDDADYQAHVALAWTYLYREDYDRVQRHMERAIKLNPHDADTLANATYLLSVLGEPEEAVKCGEIAIRLNPRHPDWYLAYLSSALFTARRYPEALAVRMRAPDVFIDSIFIGAATLAYMGRLDEAKRWADRAVARLMTCPGGARATTEGCVHLLLENNPFRRQGDRDHFAEGMRKAGVPG
ncbi:MAG TPA: adenylate/guanylate cyclase domain-containing protein [Dongiaceae bacterium]